ncbi:MAG: winged helix-turn-helix transcriptional regulator [Gemmatimonadaceae bacterium]|nr:winged helix-turn-helix transcriptional regulator [Gemmatimonadaceae bacterium]
MRQRILSGLHLGALRPGSRLPSTREIAEEFDVAPRTVMSAYRLLEAEGLIELRERSGIYVAPGGSGDTAMLTQLAGWVVEVLLDGRAREIPPIGFPERVRRCLETLRLRAVCVANNADQMEQICYELQHDYGFETESLETRQLTSGDAEVQRALRQADLLVGTALDATQVQHAARRLGKPAITVSLRREMMDDLTRQLAFGPLYLIGSDPRFRDAVRAVFAPTGHIDHLYVPIVGEDDLSAVPEDAPAYIMGRAHRFLGDSALAQRVTPIRRVFSRDMARELLTFIVRSNIAAMSARAA